MKNLLELINKDNKYFFTFQIIKKEEYEEIIPIKPLRLYDPK